MVDFEGQFKRESRALMIFLGGLGFFALLAMGIIVLSTVSKPKAVHCAVSPAELDAHPYICLSLKDSYVCNMDGEAVAYAKDGSRLPTAPKTVFMPNTGPLKIK